MTQMEEDLGTRLDWVAVDHFDTAHPHTHIIARGVTHDGKGLNIAANISRAAYAGDWRKNSLAS